MNNERDMYYGSYGYGYMPTTMTPPIQNIPSQSNYLTSQLADMNERINRLERQIKRIDQRLTRLETPYANTSNYNEPDNNMYMM